MGGQSFAFVSHVGKVQICGFLEEEAGDIRKEPFSKIWQTSKLFLEMRDLDHYHGQVRDLRVPQGLRRLPGPVLCHVRRLSGARAIFARTSPVKAKAK